MYKSIGIIGFEISDYFTRFLSYIVDLTVIMGLVTLLLVHLYNEPPLIFQFPFYYLYTHNSIHRLLFNSSGIDFLILFLLITFFYYCLFFYLGFTPGGIILNLRITYFESNHTGKLKTSRKILSLSNFGKTSLRSIFMVIPLIPLADNLLAKNAMKYTDNSFRCAIVHPLKLYDVKKSSMLKSGKKQKRMNNRLISYDEFKEFYKLKDNRATPTKKKKPLGTNPLRSTSLTTSHIDRIGKILKLKTFYMTGLTEKITNKKDTVKDSPFKVVRRSRFGMLSVGGLLYFIPFIMAIIVGWHITDATTFPTPPPLLADRFTSPQGYAEVQTSIFNNNIGIDLKFFILGGFTMFFLPFLGIYSSIYLPGITIASSLHSQFWYFTLYSILPQLIPESFGYVFGIISGLYLSKILIDSFVAYSRGENTDLFLGTIYEDMKQFLTLLAISFALILIASYIEAYVTSYIINHFYFVNS